MLYEIIASTSNLTTETMQIIEWVNLLVGFGLGLLAIIFIDWLRMHHKKRQFCVAVRSELKQLLASTLTDMINPDSQCNMDKAKIWFESQIKFDLTSEVMPSEETKLEHNYLFVLYKKNQERAMKHLTDCLEGMGKERKKMIV